MEKPKCLEGTHKGTSTVKDPTQQGLLTQEPLDLRSQCYQSIHPFYFYPALKSHWSWSPKGRQDEPLDQSTSHNITDTIQSPSIFCHRLSCTQGLSRAGPKPGHTVDKSPLRHRAQHRRETNNHSHSDSHLRTI